MRRTAPPRRRESQTQIHALPELAARLLVEGSAQGLASAKRKACSTLGVRSLPDNLAVLAALIDYQRLFDGPALDTRNTQLRTAACNAMRKFSAFDPRLVGPVLYGTTLRDTSVTLHLFADECESVTRFLLENRIPFELSDTGVRITRHATTACPLLRLSRDDIEYALVVFPHQHLRQAPMSSLTGGPCLRANLAQLEAMLALDPGGVWITAAGRLKSTFN